VPVDRVEVGGVPFARPPVDLLQAVPEERDPAPSGGGEMVERLRAGRALGRAHHVEPVRGGGVVHHHERHAGQRPQLPGGQERHQRGDDRAVRDVLAEQVDGLAGPGGGVDDDRHDAVAGLVGHLGEVAGELVVGRHADRPDDQADPLGAPQPQAARGRAAHVAQLIGGGEDPLPGPLGDPVLLAAQHVGHRRDRHLGQCGHLARRRSSLHVKRLTSGPGRCQTTVHSASATSIGEPKTTHR
jgi:hypothetical protein